MLKGKLVSFARRLYARSVTAILHQIHHVEVDEESGWVVTPTQRFESAPHPKALWPVRKGVRLIRGRQVVRLHSARPRSLSIAGDAGV